MYIPLTLMDVLTAALWACILVIGIQFVSRLFVKFIARGTIFNLRPDQLEPEQLEAVLKNCYKLFPIDSLSWNGTLFKRGNELKVITPNAHFTGEFIGVNDDDMLCLMTNHSVIAHEIRTIQDIQTIRPLR